MVIEPFTLARTPRIIFGKGELEGLAPLLDEFGRRVLLLTGGSSLRSQEHHPHLLEALDEHGLVYSTVRVRGEPSPDLVDAITSEHREPAPDVVVAIGGGSVLDAGKAVSAMLTQEESVMAYLEGVGEGRVHSGEKVPFIAVPTTSGTGSEATKNAVLSRVGTDGFKKSLRHNSFIPDVALLDPELTLSCPPDITAASGLDAITQLLEAYTSKESSPMIDTLVSDALRQAGRCFEPVCTDRQDDPDMRAGMAYAALISGIALANAGLGIVHGLASPIGGRYEIPHGVVCGTLIAEAARLNIELLRRGQGEERFLKKYARAGLLLSGGDETIVDDVGIERFCDLLVETLRGWISRFDIPPLGDYGLSEGDLEPIAAEAGLKNNPVPLSTGQIAGLVRSRL